MSRSQQYPKNCKHWLWTGVVAALTLLAACDLARDDEESKEIILAIGVQEVEPLRLADQEHANFGGTWTVDVNCSNRLPNIDLGPYNYDETFSVTGANMGTVELPVVKGLYCNCKLISFVANGEEFGVSGDQPQLGSPVMGPSSAGGIESTLFLFQAIDPLLPQHGSTETACRYGVQLKRSSEAASVDLMDIVSVRGDWVNAPSYTVKEPITGEGILLADPPIQDDMHAFDIHLNCMEHEDEIGDEESCQGVKANDLMYALIDADLLDSDKDVDGENGITDDEKQLFDSTSWAYQGSGNESYWNNFDSVGNPVDNQIMGPMPDPNDASQTLPHMIWLKNVVAQTPMQSGTIDSDPTSPTFQKLCHRLAFILKNGPKHVCDELTDKGDPLFNQHDCSGAIGTNPAKLFSFQIFTFRACIPPPSVAIEISKSVQNPFSGAFSKEAISAPVGGPVTFGYFVSNPGEVPIANIRVVDDRATPSDPSDDLSSDSGGGIVFMGGDNGNALLDPGEVWEFHAQTTVNIAGSSGLGDVSETNKYLLIGSTSNDIAKAVNVQNGDLGANIIVLSTDIDDNVDFDLDDVFLNNAGSVWVDVDNAYSTNPDYLPGAAQISERVSWSGDIALTSPTAAFDMSNVELYGQIGVIADSVNPASSVSNTEFFSFGLGDGFDNTGQGLAIPSNGVNSNADTAMAALRGELENLEEFVTELATEATLILPSPNGIVNVDVLELLVDPFDVNGDGVAVIDINTGSNDFSITNSNWIIESENGTFALFRILGDSNLVLNQSTIVIGDGTFGNGGIAGAGFGNPSVSLGAIFVKASKFKNAQGSYHSGESLTSSDTVLSFNDTVLNGVGFYDLVAFAEENMSPASDNGTTELKINNGQGCSHFISPKINFSNVRFERCALPGGGRQSNVGTVTGSVSGVTYSDSDTQTIFVTSE